MLWLLLCVLFFVVGCFTNVATVVLILGPMIKPVLEFFGIDAMHFCIIAVMMSQIGFVTPPFGLCLFTTMKIAEVSMKDVIRGAWPFLVAMVISTIILILFPALTTFLPNLVYGA